MTPDEVRQRAADMCKASGDTETARAEAYEAVGEREPADRCRHRAATSYFLEKRIREDDGTAEI